MSSAFSAMFPAAHSLFPSLLFSPVMVWKAPAANVKHVVVLGLLSCTQPAQQLVWVILQGCIPPASNSPHLYSATEHD